MYVMLVKAKQSGYKKTFDMKLDSLDEKTKRGYGISLKNFEKFYFIKHGEIDLIKDLKSKKRDQVFNELQAWVNWNGKNLTATTTKSYFSRIKNYLNFCGIEITSEQIKIKLNFPKNHKERFYAISLDDIDAILRNADYKHNAMFLCQLSSGMRIGELVQLRKNDLTYDNQRFIVDIPSRIAKNKKGRITFFSREASHYLKQLLKNLADNDLIFGTNENAFHSEINEEQIFRRILIKTGLTKRYSISKRYQISTHSLRAFFITKVSRHDPNLAHFLSGQESKIYLAQYDRMTDKEMLNVYLKIEPDLIIKDRDKFALEDQKTEIQLLRQEVADMKKIFQKKGEKPVSYVFVKDTGEYYTQDADSTVFRKSSKKFSKEDLEELKELSKD